MTTRLFITDFDGVICDSVLECLLVSYNAYHTLTNPSYTRVLSLDVIAPEKQQQFRQLRPYLKGAEDFVPMYLAMEKGVAITNQQDFNTFRTQHESELPTYQRAFYAERDYLQQHKKDIWLGLNPLFDGLKELFLACKSFERMHILTTKRQQDVVEIFEYQQIPFPIDHIVYMKAAGKSQKLLDMLHAHQVAFQDCVYVEDQVDFVVASKQHGIGSYLVDWGYVSAEQQDLARQHDVPIIQPQDFAELLQSVQ
jgi:phosphoglycolate phosphatase-like HAD superfamily hydrolase